MRSAASVGFGISRRRSYFVWCVGMSWTRGSWSSVTGTKLSAFTAIRKRATEKITRVMFISLLMSWLVSSSDLWHRSWLIFRGLSQVIEALCHKTLADESKPSEIMESPLSDATWTFSDEGVHSVHRHQWSQGEVVEAPSMLGSLLQLDVVASSASAQGSCPVSTVNTINLDWGLGGVHIGAAGDMYYVLCTCYTGYDSTPVLAVFNRQNLQIVSYSQWPKPVVPHFTRTGWFSRHFYRILATPILTVLYGLGLIDLPPLYRTPPSPDSAQISRGKYMERTSLALSICDLAGHHNWLWI